MTVIFLCLTEHERQGSELSMGGGIPKNEEVDAWTVHKTEAGTLYYYNRLTGKSTYEKPLNFKGEVLVKRVYCETHVILILQCFLF